jgi:hypothetical protein
MLLGLFVLAGVGYGQNVDSRTEGREKYRTETHLLKKSSSTSNFCSIEQ